MRVRHQLWKVSNGWLLVPESCTSIMEASEAPNSAVFKSLKEFADYKPKRVRRSRKATTKETQNAN